MGEMRDQSDAQLLREYAERGAEASFAEIVVRHTDLVYSAALRQVHSPDLARDVTQSVFTDLARKARAVSASLSPQASLVGWLYRGTRFAARDLYRNETRRTHRERQAMEQFLSAPETAPDWEQLRPVLDDAMSELDDTDRDAVLLRYFKNHDLRTVGATLGISDDAAQKRVSRAVERLRAIFAKRGVTVGASGLAVVISANAVQAAPVGLALTISTAAALAGTTLATTATVTATKAIAMTALQKTIFTATIVVLAGAGIHKARQVSQLRDQVQTLQQQQDEQIQRLQNDRDAVENRLAALTDEMERGRGNSSELLKLRGEVARLRKEAQVITDTSKEARDFQADMMHVLSNMPVVKTFVSTAVTTTTWDQAIVTGGWKTPAGRRAITLVTLHQGEDGKQLTISSRLLEYTEQAGEKLGLSRFNLDEQTSDGLNTRAKAHTITKEQSEAILKAAKDLEGTQIIAAPSVSTLSGRQAQIQVVDIHSGPSGEKYSTGPVLDFIPTIAPDGQTVQMVFSAQLAYRIPAPQQ